MASHAATASAVPKGGASAGRPSLIKGRMRFRYIESVSTCDVDKRCASLCLKSFSLVELHQLSDSQQVTVGSSTHLSGVMVPLSAPA